MHAHGRNRPQLCQGSPPPPPTQYPSFAPSKPAPATRLLGPAGKRVGWKTKQDALAHGAALAPRLQLTFAPRKLPPPCIFKFPAHVGWASARVRGLPRPAPPHAAIGGLTGGRRGFPVLTDLPELCVTARATIGGPASVRRASLRYGIFWAEMGGY